MTDETYSTLSDVLSALDECERLAERLPTASAQEAERIHGALWTYRQALEHAALCDPIDARGTDHYRRIRNLEPLNT